MTQFKMLIFLSIWIGPALIAEVLNFGRRGRIITLIVASFCAVVWLWAFHG